MEISIFLFYILIYIYIYIYIYIRKGWTYEKGLNIWTFEHRCLISCYFKLKSRLICWFTNRGETTSRCYFKEIENESKNLIFILGGTEPPFRANLLLGYYQSGSERTSFSGSTIQDFHPFWIRLKWYILTRGGGRHT